MESDTARSPRSAAISPEDRQAHLVALLAGNHLACYELTRALLAAGVEIRDIYQDLYSPALYEIGAMWAGNRVSVASEHMATSITEGLMNQVYADLGKPSTKGRSVVLACVEGETHQVGIKMVADIFEFHGWDAHFLGPGTATSDLLEYIEGVEPAVIALSVTLHFNLPSLAGLVAEIRARFPAIPIIIGGQGVQHGEGDVLQACPLVTLASSLEDLEAFIHRQESSLEENAQEGRNQPG